MTTQEEGSDRFLYYIASGLFYRLDQIRSSAVQAGDAAQLAEIDRQVIETNATLDKLQSQG